MNPGNWFQSYLASQTTTRPRRRVPNQLRLSPNRGMLGRPHGAQRRSPLPVPPSTRSAARQLHHGGQRRPLHAVRHHPRAGRQCLRRRQRRRRPPLQRHDRPATSTRSFPRARADSPSALTPGWPSVPTATYTSPASNQSDPGIQRQHGRLHQGLRLGRVGRTHDPRGLTFGPDGNLYVSSSSTTRSCAIKGPLGSLSRQHRCRPPASPGRPSSHRPAAACSAPLNLIFGPDGNLYVDGGQHWAFLRYNGTTGAFMRHVRPARGPADGDLAVRPGHGLRSGRPALCE